MKIKTNTNSMIPSMHSISVGEFFSLCTFYPYAGSLILFVLLASNITRLLMITVEGDDTDDQQCY